MVDPSPSSSAAGADCAEATALDADFARRISALKSEVRAVRCLQHNEVREATERLAVTLREKIGSDDLRRFRFCAIPRGGLFVLGYLSYFLDLSQEQFIPSSDVPLVIVDDCSISGARFRTFRRRHSGPSWFAHLYSHPDLRAAIERSEADVLGCVAAHDLRDLAPTLYPDPAEYAAWHQRCLKRASGERYWIGIPERLAFPWTEPDSLIWNSQLGAFEAGWRLVSPDRCLHNRRLLGVPDRPSVKRGLRLPDAVTYHLAVDQVSLCDLRSEECFSLRDASAAMWRALVAYGEPVAAAEYVAALYNVALETVVADAHLLTGELLARNLLERVGAE